MEEKLKEYKTTHKRCADCAFFKAKAFGITMTVTAWCALSYKTIRTPYRRRWCKHYMWEEEYGNKRTFL